MQTYDTDYMVTDSAASATAYLTGSKGNHGTIGVDVNVKRGDCESMLVEEYHTQSILRDFQASSAYSFFLTFYKYSQQCH